MSKVDFPLVHLALRRAHKQHKKQDRGGENAIPYLTHSLEVLSLVRYVGGVTDEDVLCAAVLHDVLEHTEMKPEDLLAEFGPRVTSIVLELTREEPIREGLTAEEIRDLKTQMMLADIDRMSVEARTIKLADRISNLQQVKLTEEGDALERYMVQSQLIQDHIPSGTNTALRSRLSGLLRRREPTKTPTSATPRRRAKLG
ncbi:hypothetical protein BH11ARM1_BH11ARM1_00850 [soil metagenome]